MEELISRITQIDKTKLDEREFYEAVLSIINEIKPTRLTDEDYEQLKSALLTTIGCRSYDTWMEQILASGKNISDITPIDLVNGNISVAVFFISQLLISRKDAEYTLSKFTEGRESWASIWINGNMSSRKLASNPSPVEPEGR